MGIRNREKEGSISLDWLRGLLSYDPETGKLTWLRARRKAGLKSEVGCIRPDGYRTVMIKGNAFLAANLIWFLVHGEWPLDSLDHVNRDRGDDRLCNLRPASQTENNFNQKIRFDNTTGVRGVSPDRARGGFIARLNLDGVLVSSKRFKSFEAAVSHRKELEQRYCGDFLPQEARV